MDLKIWEEVSPAVVCNGWGTTGIVTAYDFVESNGTPEQMDDRTELDNCTTRVFLADRRIEVLVIGEWKKDVDSTQVVSEGEAAASIVSAGSGIGEDEDDDGADHYTTYSSSVGSCYEQLEFLAKIKLFIVARGCEDENLGQLLRLMQAEIRAERVEALGQTCIDCCLGALGSKGWASHV